MSLIRNRAIIWCIGFLGVSLAWAGSLWADQAPSPIGHAKRLAAEGNIGAAIDVLDRVSDAGRRSVELLDLRAQLHLMAGNDAAAERDWSRVVDLDPTAITPRLALAKLHSLRALWPGAIRLYREVLVYAPWNVHAILGLASAYEQSGRVVGAARLIEAAATGISDPRIQERWAQVALRFGDPADAERALTLIAEGATGLAKRDALNRLAKLRADDGRHEAALATALESAEVEKNLGGSTVETYDLVVAAADRVMTATAEQVGAVLHDLDGGVVTREEALAAAETARLQVAEAEAALQAIDAPSDRKSSNAGRLYAYSLLGEALLSGLLYIDVGGAERREGYTSALESARAELTRVERVASDV